MADGAFLTISAQVATHLRGKILRGHWKETIPGIHQLAEELRVNRKTVEAALRQLEREGLLEGQGAGRKRRIALPADASAAHPLRVGILLGEPADRRLDYIIELQHELVEAGHVASFAVATMLDLEMNAKRVGRMVEKTSADAWVVASGSREVLEWFVKRELTVFALFGRRRGLPIAGGGPDKVSVLTTVMSRFFELGHQRIVLLVRPRRRLPQPGAFERAFLAELEARDIRTGAYNLPDWKETVEGFHACLESLFQVTPPTALIIDEAPLFAAAQQFLARQGLRVPEDVSLVCTDPDPTFEWCNPTIAHIRWDSRPLARRIVRWAANVSCGKQDLRQTFTQAGFVAGGTIGPVPGG